MNLLIVNRRSEIVGSYYNPNELKGPAEHGFLLSGGVFTAIDVPNAAATLAIGINSSGDIAGSDAILPLIENASRKEATLISTAPTSLLVVSSVTTHASTYV